MPVEIFPADRQLTYWEKLVGFTFNPSWSVDVQTIKKFYADIIDLLNNERMTVSVRREKLYSIAIEKAATAQMWAVKAITWKE